MDWQELIALPGGEEGSPAPSEAGQASGGGVFARLRDRLQKSRTALRAELSASLFDQLDAATWERLEEALILADVERRRPRRWSADSSARSRREG